ncbi:HRDC domain-containing protein [Formosa sp. 4Alg 33]|uniref:HRDC domain-containing protein n=1 Tax=Formosa sp. 4Alg 33 TaxID=3382189 RepID=UPI003D9C32BE
MQLINSDYNFSIFKNLYQKIPQEECDINQLIEIIKYGYLKNEITQLRNTKDKSERNKLKTTQLPCVTLSGVFKERNSKGLIEHIGLLQIDIDDIANYNEVFNQVKQDEYTYVAFKSPSGNGLKVIVKINESEETHLEQFYAFEKYYKEEYNIIIDKACKDISRCMLLSYDEHLFCNPFSDVFPELHLPPVKKVPIKEYPVNGAIHVTGNKEVDVVEAIAKEVENNSLDITSTYEEWLRVGFSLSSVLGESGREYYHRLSKYNTNYTYQETDKKFNVLYSRNNGAIGLGTLIYIAKQYGIQIKYTTQQQPTKPKKITQLTDAQLEYILKEKRLQWSREHNAPAYRMFNDKSLADLIAKRPKTKSELEKVFGFGSKKIEDIGELILNLINDPKEIDSVPKTQSFTLTQPKEEDLQLTKVLKEWRFDLSIKKGIKPFWILRNSSLQDIVTLKPTATNQLFEIKGISTKTVEHYGEAIITILNEFKS